jgi:hypothetical protein
MLYNVIALTKKVVEQGKQNAGTNYVVVTLEDPQDGETREVPVFDAESKRYMDLIPNTAVGVTTNLPENTPDNLKVWKNCRDEEFVFPELMVRVENGKPSMNKFNQLRVRKSVMVMTRRKMDNEHPEATLAEMAYRRGWDLTTRGTSVMNAFYMPASQFQQAAGPSQQDENEPV